MDSRAPASLKNRFTVIALFGALTIYKLQEMFLACEVLQHE
jgi:hypothetical protein